jgi:nicotinate-nucleotide adenylyltransferase
MGYDEIFLYCGTDMLLSFDTWFHFEDILRSCTLVYASRLENEDPAVQAKMTMLREKYGAKIKELDIHPIEISSSEIREMIRKGEDASAFLSPAVLDFISERGLYR